MAEPLFKSSEIERDIVSLSFKDTQFFLDIHEFLKPDHLIDEIASEAWKYTLAYFKQQHHIPPKHVIWDIMARAGTEVPEDWFKTEDIPDVEWLTKETVKLIREQEFKEFIMKCAEEADSGKPDYEKLELDLKNVLSISPMSDLGMFYFDLDERFARIKATQSARTPTGIEVIDAALEGGLAAKELVGVAAPSGVGKSYVLAIAGAHMLVNERKNILHYTMEMSEERTSLRYDMAILNLSIPDIMEDVDEAKRRLAAHTIKNRRLVIKEFPTKSATVGTLRTHLYKLKEQRDFIPDVVIVDYGDIMKATGRHNSKYDEQGAIFQELRGLAQEFNVPILTATQTNRGSVGKDVIGQEDLGDSYDKARIMDALFTIVQKPEEKEDGLFKIYEAKVRNEASGRLHGYRINYATAQLEYVGKISEEDE